MTTISFVVDTVVDASAIPQMQTYGAVFVARGVTVASRGAVPLLAWDDGYHFFNIFGNVIGNEKAIWLEGEENRIFLGSEGTIIGSANGTGDNWGMGIYVAGEDTRIENRGMILGQTHGITLVAGGDDKSVVLNKGEISGSEFGFRTADETIIFRNRGSLSSEGEAFHGSSKADRLINSGLIEGQVTLGNGADLYDGRKGWVDEGSINGGLGDDDLRGGAESDWLNGGAGNDTLSGGAGTDVFMFDTALSATTNVDKILDFAAANDIIAVNSAIFNLDGVNSLDGMFLANKTGKAESTADHFIYQTTSGRLVYDLDGKGGAEGVLFAVLDRNLKLTADNFDIV